MRRKSTSVFVLTALTASWSIFHTKAVYKLTSQTEGKSFRAGDLRSFEIVPLETVSETSANASIGDLNGDGYLDIVLAKGRHWPVPSRVFFGDGKGNFTPGPNLPSKATKTYSASLADMTKSGHLDMVLSNDEPEPKLILLNDGKGNFSVGGLRRESASLAHSLSNGEGRSSTAFKVRGATRRQGRTTGD
jgi:hypothetical protein